MENVNKHTIEKLIEIGSFSNLSTVQKQVVLKEMTAEEFDRIRNVMFTETPLISNENFTVEPKPFIQKELLNKVKTIAARKSVIRQIYIYGSSVAAVSILLLLTYTYFSQVQTKTKVQSIVQVKDEVLPKEISNKSHTDSIQPIEQENLAQVENKVIKRKLNTSQIDVNEEKGSADNPEEFKFLAAEIAINAIDEDASLASHSDESEQVFHYYTRLE
jgi:hypothetical protein